MGLKMVIKNTPSGCFILQQNLTVVVSTGQFVSQVGPGSPGEENGNPLQNSCLGNPVDRSLVGCHSWGHKDSDMI